MSYHPPERYLCCGILALTTHPLLLQLDYFALSALAHAWNALQKMLVITMLPLVSSLDPCIRVFIQQLSEQMNVQGR